MTDITIGDGARPSGLRGMSSVAQLMSAHADTFDGIGKTRKGALLATFKQAAPAFGLSDNALLLVDQLMAFSKECDWEEGRRPIVWPSNDFLQDALGKSLRSIQYARRELEDAGVVVMRDSPQGRRFGYRGPDGHIKVAYGFDLSPLALRQDEWRGIAEDIKQIRRDRQALKRRRTIALKATRQIIATALEIGLDVNEWSTLGEQNERLIAGTHRQRDLMVLRPLVDRLEHLKADAEAYFLEQVSALETLDDEQEHASQGAEDCTLNTTTTDLKSNKLDTVDTRREVDQISSSEGVANKSTSPPPDAVADSVEDTLVKYQIKPQMVIGLSTWMTELVPKDRPATWDDVVGAGSRLRKLTGISDDAWRDAVETIGVAAASTAVAIVMAKRGEIKKPGGYFRGMVEKAKLGQLNLGPTVYGLLDKERGARQPEVSV